MKLTRLILNCVGVLLVFVQIYSSSGGGGVLAVSCTNESYPMVIHHPKEKYLVRYDTDLMVHFCVMPEPIWWDDHKPLLWLDTQCYCDGHDLGSDDLCKGRQTPTVEHVKGDTAWYWISLPKHALSSCRGKPFKSILRISCASSTGEVVSKVELNVRVESIGLSVTYVITCVLSLIVGLFTVHLYARFPRLRKFPSNMMIIRTIIDMLFACQLLWVNIKEIENDSDDACNAVVAFVTQFTLLSSLAWYMALALNFHFSVTNPFTRPQNYMPLYHGVIWTAAVVSGGVIAFRYGYRSDYQLCWIPKTSGINVLNWAFYLAWLVLFAVFAIVLLGFGYKRLNKPHYLQETIAKRQEALTQTRVYVTAFTVYWVTAAIIWGIVYSETRNELSDTLIQERSLAYTFACVAGLMGFVDSVAWLVVQRTNIDHLFRTKLHHWCPCLRAVDWDLMSRVFSPEVVDDDDGNYHFDDISEALRYEFITNTSQGIIASTRSIEEYVECGGAHLSESEYGSFMYLPVREVPRGSLSNRSGIGAKATSGIASMQVPLMKPQVRGTNALVPLTTFPVDDTHEDAVFDVYAPLHFAELREIFGVDAEEFTLSMQGDVGEMQQNFSEGRSGSFFYKTTDQMYLVKTLTVDEKDLLLEILPSYILYMKQNSRSLICRFYGLYSITLYDSNVYFVVMNNWLRCDDGIQAPLSEVYDLKGSSINRRTNPPPEGKVKTRKDADLNHAVRVKSVWGVVVKKQLQRDATFMRDHNIMDYSLLLGIRHVESRYEFDNNGGDTPVRRLSMQRTARSHSYSVMAANRMDRGDVVGSDLPPPGSGMPAEVVVGPGIYHVGIIDVLQRWNWEKRMELYFKILARCHCYTWKRLSCVEPTYYAMRFVEMTERVFLYVPPSQGLSVTSPNRRAPLASEGE